ncbi:MAG: ATP-binding protein [Deltaproteobacteria bacterium]|nr:ATP-binding protein [Deltaproteobacteria bacterium]
MDQFRTVQHYWTSQDWLGKRMLFLSGPRQVGKTTLVKDKLCRIRENYFNWDSPQVRSSYRKDSSFFVHDNLKSGDWVCFDEIHKRPRWKDILKGVYDVYNDRCRFVITGSARLEVFRKSGDSLVGRYFLTHLFPLNFGDFKKNDFKLFNTSQELLSDALDQKDSHEIQQTLLNLGGFPEPFFSGREQFWKRWHLQHEDLILREDLRDLTRIQEMDKIAALLDCLRPSIGGTTSNLSLGEDLEASHTTIKRWLEELSKVSLIFKVPAYSKNLRRVYRKEAKWYFVDWRAVEKNRFENYVAATLDRAATLLTDRYGERFSLFFIRTHQGDEVDFVLTKNNRPYLLIEAKEGKPEPSLACYTFCQKLNIPCVVVSSQPGWSKILNQNSQHPMMALLSFNKLAQVLP